MAEDPTPTPTHLPPPPRPSVNPNEALDLLGDLESRLSQLRAWQSENDKHAEQVREQSEQLDSRQQQIEEDRKSVV